MLFCGIQVTGQIRDKKPLNDTCICYNWRMDSLAISCMLKQRYKDTIIVARGRRIESFTRVIKLDSILQIGYRETIFEQGKEITDLEKKKKRNFKIGGLLGLLVGLMTQFLF